MKNLKILLLTFFAIIGFNSCQDDDDLVFTAAPEAEFTYVNTFLDDYILNTNASSNIVERFVYNAANFNTPSPVNYVLENSILGDFTDATVVGGQTTSNEIAVTVGQMMELAQTAGIGVDESGALSFRVKAFLGDLVTATEFSYTPTQLINVTIPSQSTGSGIEPSTWGVVGSGYNNWGGAGPDGQFYTTSQAGVIVSYVTLVDGEIKFRENNTWSGDLGDATGDGVLDADPDNNIAVTAGNYKITIDTNTNNYTIEEFSWGIVGSGYNDWGNGGPDFALTEIQPNIFVGDVATLVEGEIKFRKNNNWGGDLGDANGDNILDADPENNISVTAGGYRVRIDFSDNSYQLNKIN